MAAQFSAPMYCLGCRVVFYVYSRELGAARATVVCPNGVHRAIVVQSEDRALQISPRAGEEGLITRFPELFWRNAPVLIVTMVAIPAIALCGLWTMTLMLPIWACPFTFLVFVAMLLILLTAQMEAAGVLKQGTTTDHVRAYGNWFKGVAKLGSIEKG